jgi:4a-hydroxytetrahydrobiopterin dehydratase
MKPLSRDEFDVVRPRIPEWKRRGEVIRRTFEFADFKAALRFVNAVGRAAESMQHHPDIDIRWNRVRLALTTHDAGGLTTLDVDLAAKCDRLAVSSSAKV